MDEEINEPIGATEDVLPPDELFTGALSISDALETLRLRLLDLTGRNRLLNFKPTAGKSQPFVEGSLSTCYQKLVESSDRRIPLHPVPEPKRVEFVEKLGRMVRPEVREYAKALGISTSYELPDGPRREKELAGLRALAYPDELERQCRKLATAAKTAIEETGANMLFLLLGFLEYRPEQRGFVSHALEARQSEAEEPGGDSQREWLASFGATGDEPGAASRIAENVESSACLRELLRVRTGRKNCCFRSK